MGKKIKKTTSANFDERFKKFGEYLKEGNSFDVFDDVLDELLNNDFFGTEGQCDPRGDHRS